MENAAMSMMRRLRRGIVVGSLAVAGVTTTSPAWAQEPTLDGVQISGDPVVGSTLTAVISGSIDPAEVSFKWCREGDRAGRCAPGAPAGVGAVYVPVATDVGYRLLVTARAKVDKSTSEVTSSPTAPVVASPPPDPVPEPAPEPTPAPTPEPTPAPAPGTAPDPTTVVSSTPDATAPAPTFGSPAVTPAGAVLGAPETRVAEPAALRYLAPFPVVRIRGRLAVGGARVTMLKVTAPQRATVQVRCDGSGCPSIRPRSRPPGRIRALERFLVAGTRITIRVRRPGYIGKYVRIKIRAGRPPSRHDACLMPGSARPAECPLA
jgi:hypothetical protein